MIKRDEAQGLLHEWVDSPSLRRHCATLAHVMERASGRYGEPDADADVWFITGLLHDADYERHPDEHPRRIVAWLRARGEETIAHAIECHATFLHVPCTSALDRALLACDELTGFVVACAMTRPDGLLTLEPASVMKKLKDKRFAAGVHREDVIGGAELLQVPLAEHIGFVIAALRERAADFSLAGARPA